MASTLLITNPDSRSGGRDIEQAAERLRDQDDVDLVRPGKPRLLSPTIGERAAEINRAVPGGGNGTINLALDALEVDRPVGILPLGTANG